MDLSRRPRVDVHGLLDGAGCLCAVLGVNRDSLLVGVDVGDDLAQERAAFIVVTVVGPDLGQAAKDLLDLPVDRERHEVAEFGGRQLVPQGSAQPMLKVPDVQEVDGGREAVPAELLQRQVPIADKPQLFGLEGSLLRMLDPVTTEDPEITVVLVEADHVAQEGAQHGRVMGADRARRGHGDGSRKSGIRRSRSTSPPLVCRLAPIRRSPFGVRATRSGSSRPVSSNSSSGLYERIQASSCSTGVVAVHQRRHLVRPEGALDLQPVDHFRPCPAFRGAQHDHRPQRPRGIPPRARTGLVASDLFDRPVGGAGHQFMHRLGLVALHVVRVPAAPRSNASNSSRSIRANTVGLLIL